jgi:chromate reductase
MRLLAISGSLRADSHNTRLLREIAERAPEGVEIEIWNGLRSIPPYDGDDDQEGTRPESVTALRDAIAEADGLLFATPEYNASISGVLKNAVDWASSRPAEFTPLHGKPAAVVGATTGQFGAVWAQAELRKVLATAGARVVDLDLPIAKADNLINDYGALIAEDHTDGRCRELLGALVAEIQRDRELAIAA